MSAIHELKKILYGVAPAISEHAIIYTGDPRPVEVVMLEVFEEVEAELAALKAERDVLRQVAILAINAVIEAGVQELKPQLAKLDHYLANELPEDMWEELDNAAKSALAAEAK